MLTKRKFEIVWVKDHRGGVDLTVQPHQVVEYNGDAVYIDPSKK